jgi:hypothetical protein
MRAMPTAGEAPTPLPRAARWRFAGFAAALAAGVSARTTAEGASWLGVRGPACPLGACLGPLVCPGCGLVRSTAAALQGDVALAWRAHPAGLATAALLVGGALLHFDILRQRAESPAHRRWRRFGQLAFGAALLLGWLTRFLSN